MLDFILFIRSFYLKNIYGVNIPDDSDLTDFYEVVPERLEIIAPTSQVFHKRYLQRDFSLPASSALRFSFIKSKR